MNDSLVVIWGASLGALLLREIVRRYTGQDNQEKNRIAIAQEGKTAQALQTLFLENKKLGSIIFDDGKKMYCLLRLKEKDTYIQYLALPLHSEAALNRIHLIRYFLKEPKKYYKQLHEETSSFVYSRLKDHPEIGPLIKKMKEKRIWTSTKLPFLDRGKDQKTSDSMLNLIFPLVQDGGINNLSGACHMAIRYTANDQGHIIVKPFTLREMDSIGKVMRNPGHIDPEILLDTYLEIINPRIKTVVDMCLAQEKSELSD